MVLKPSSSSSWYVQHATPQACTHLDAGIVRCQRVFSANGAGFVTSRDGRKLLLKDHGSVGAFCNFLYKDHRDLNRAGISIYMHNDVPGALHNLPRYLEPRIHLLHWQGNSPDAGAPPREQYWQYRQWMQPVRMCRGCCGAALCGSVSDRTMVSTEIYRARSMPSGWYS